MKIRTTLFWITFFTLHSLVAQQNTKIDAWLKNDDLKKAALAIEALSKNQETRWEGYHYKCLLFQSFQHQHNDSVLFYAKKMMNPKTPMRYQILGHIQMAEYHYTKAWQAKDCIKNIDFVNENYPKHKGLFSKSEQVYIELEQSTYEFLKANFSKASQLALEVYDQIPQMHPDYLFANEVLNNAGLTLLSLRPDLGLECLEKAIENTDENLPKNWPKLVTLYNNLGQCNIRIGNFKAVIEAQNKSWEISQKMAPGNYHVAYEHYWHLGWLHEEMGNYTSALHYYQTCLDVIEERGQKESMDHLMVSSFILHMQGKLGLNPVLAKPKYEFMARQSVEVFQSPEFKAYILSIQAQDYFDKGFYKEASRILQDALKITNPENSLPNYLHSTRLLARCYAKLGNPSKAQKLFEHCILEIKQNQKVNKKLPYVIETQLAYANFLFDTGQIKKCYEFLQSSFSTKTSSYLELNYEIPFLKSKIYLAQYKQNAKQESLSLAVETAKLTIEKALGWFPLIRTFEEKNRYLQSLGKMTEDFKEMALEWHKIKPEEGVEMLLYLCEVEKYNLVRRNLAFNSEVELYQNYGSEAQKLNTYNQRFIALERQLATEGLLPLVEQELLAERENLLLKIEDLEQKLYANETHFLAHQKYPSLVGIQKHCKLAKRNLLVGFEFKNEFYTLFITPTTSILQKQNVSLATLQALNQTAQKAMQHNNATDFKHAAEQLYTYLFKPQEKHLNHNSISIFMPLELGNLNFDYLIRQSQGLEFADFPYLIFDFEFHQLASVQYLLQEEKQPAARNTSLLQLAPIFSNDVKTYFTQNASVQDSVYLNLPTQYFVDKHLVQNPMPSTITLSGIDANYASALNQMPHHPKILLNSHTQINNTKPLESKIFLSYSPQDSRYFLTPKDIYKTPLNSQFILLSACKTGVSTNQSGKSLFSLAHSFMHAGAQNVVYTLWDVDEKSNTEIVRRFLSRQQNSINTPLREAKIDFIKSAKDPKLHNPYYWAGLMVVGHEPLPHNTLVWWHWFLLILSVILFGFMAWRLGLLKAQ